MLVNTNTLFMRVREGVDLLGLVVACDAVSEVHVLLLAEKRSNP